MPECDPFTITLHGVTEDPFAGLAQVIQEHGGSLTGDARGGQFYAPIPVGGAIAGEYRVHGQKVTIHVTSRPAFVPCSQVENRLHDFLLEAIQRARSKKA